MSNKPLDFSVLDQAASAGHGRRWKSRDVNPVVQMSLRMAENVYERFRKHCEEDRRTNGEMLEIMMAAYEKQQRDLNKPSPE